MAGELTAFDLARGWREPTILEIGETVADAERIIRSAADVWLHVPVRKFRTTQIHLNKAAVLRGLKFHKKTDPMPIHLYITPPHMAGSAWVGRED